jgi:zinc transporter ZupT
MALGAGALLFAVTVELYGHALRELETGRAGLLEMLATVGGALVGAVFYLAVNRWLENILDQGIEDLESPQISPRPVPTETTHLTIKVKAPPLSLTSAMHEERRRWEEVTTPKHLALPIDPYDTPRYGAESPNKTRGRDKALVRMTSAPSPRCLSARKNEAPSPVPSPVSKTTSMEPAQTMTLSEAELAKRGKHVAFALFLGILVDGVPEGLLMGFLAAEGHLSAVLIISLLVANFPEAFSSASLMRQGGVATSKIISMWTGLCVMVGVLAGSACFLLKHFFPTYPGGSDLPQSLLISVAIVEGITGGAMIACISTVMLPEAFQRSSKEGTLFLTSGFLCTTGFLLAVVLKALEHHYNNVHETRALDRDPMHHSFLAGYSFW